LGTEIGDGEERSSWGEQSYWRTCCRKREFTVDLCKKTEGSRPDCTQKGTRDNADDRFSTRLFISILGETMGKVAGQNSRGGTGRETGVISRCQQR